MATVHSAAAPMMQHPQQRGRRVAHLGGAGGAGPGAGDGDTAILPGVGVDICSQRVQLLHNSHTDKMLHHGPSGRR